MPRKPQVEELPLTVCTPAERRQQERYPVFPAKPVQVQWLEPQLLTGRLVEVSRSGCRIRHRHRPLEEGQEVRICFPWGELRAKARWNRLRHGEVETGFSLMDET
jgi:hypothetical protein